MKSYYHKIVALVAIGVLAISLPPVLSAWQEPTATPPANNVPAPINVSSVNQTKAGNLGLGGASASVTNGLSVNGIWAVYAVGTGYGVYGSGGTTGVYGNGDYGLYGNGNNYGVYGNSTSGSGVYAKSVSNRAVYATSTSSSGVYGAGVYGVEGYSATGRGVSGSSTSGYGVYGNSTSSAGIFGFSDNDVGVWAQGGDKGVLAVGTNAGVEGYSSFGDGVYGGTSKNTGHGVYGIHEPTSNLGYLGSITAGVYGDGLDWGVYGQGGVGGVKGHLESMTSVNGVLGFNSGGLIAGAYGAGSITGRGVYGVGGAGGVEGRTLGGPLSATGILGYQAGSTMYGLYTSTTDSSAWSGYFTGGQGVYIQNRLGIGTTSPGYQLHVNGDVAGVGPYNELSDVKYKTNIEKINGALNKVMTLRGVQFDWRAEDFPELNFDSGRQIGLIAQEVQAVFPEAISLDKDGNLSVAYSRLVPVLIEAIKEQQNQINYLQSQIDELRSLID